MSVKVNLTAVAASVCVLLSAFACGDDSSSDTTGNNSPPPPSCVPNMGCNCADGAPGAIVCNADGSSHCSACPTVLVTPPTTPTATGTGAPAACAPNTTVYCTCPDGVTQGTAVCDAAGVAGLCTCTGVPPTATTTGTAVCTDGATQGCSCTDGATGFMTCAGGQFPPCDCTAPTATATNTPPPGCQNGLTCQENAQFFPGQFFCMDAGIGLGPMPPSCTGPGDPACAGTCQALQGFGNFCLAPCTP